MTKIRRRKEEDVIPSSLVAHGFSIQHPLNPDHRTLKEQKIQDCYLMLTQQSPGQDKWEAGSREKAEVVWGLKRLRQLLSTVKGK